MLVNSSEDPSARLEAVEVALKALPSVSSLGRDVGVLEDLAYVSFLLL